MVKIKTGFKLFQPWASEVSNGAMPYLIRSINTHIRSRVGVVALSKIDSVWLKHASNKWKNEIIESLHEGVIGSVEIIDSIEVEKSNLKHMMIKLAGKKYWDEYYPKYLVPQRNKLFIWALGNAKRWKKPFKIGKAGGITWVKLSINDEQ